MLRRLQDSRLRYLRCIGCACFFTLFFSFAYLPIDTPLSHGSVSAAVVVHKDIRPHYHHNIAKSGLPQDFPPQVCIIAPDSRFLKVDRKQNLPQWPVIYIGLTRSPPHQSRINPAQS